MGIFLFFFSKKEKKNMTLLLGGYFPQCFIYPEGSAVESDKLKRMDERSLTSSDWERPGRAWECIVCMINVAYIIPLL